MAIADQHCAAFKEEAYELLAELETSLLEMEERPDDTDLIGRVFRAMHTIKGSGSMFGFDDIAKFTHEIETVFDNVRNGKVPVTNELIRLTLAARDQIKVMLDASCGGEAADIEKSKEIVSMFRKLLPAGSGEVPSPALPTAPPNNNLRSEDDGAELTTYRIRFRPAPDIFLHGMNPLFLLSELHLLGKCKIVAHTSDVPYLENLAPEHSYFYWDAILTTDKGINAIKDIFIFVIDDSELKIEVIDESHKLDTESNYKKLGEILIEKGDLNADDLQKMLAGQKRIGELLVESGLVKPSAILSALAEQEHLKEVRKEHQVSDAVSSVRVSSEKLDKLVDLVGELVTVQARLSSFTMIENNPALNLISEEVERLTEDLRDNTMSIRMLPIGTTFSKFKRLVHDLSKELGKEIEMTTEGAETELDKTVIERLNDPLVHLIRNSIDHGIELPAVRETAGKPPKGTVHLSAVHSGAHVLIQIRDDGAGLDPEVIRTKAIEKGLITANSELSEKELFSLILAPGFSTAKQVTNVSGRGVGMDVVKRGIDALRGEIEIKSRKGIETTITLKLPLTLAIIDGFLVRVAGEYFVMPLSIVAECMELARHDTNRTNDRNIVNVRNQIVPYIRLREHFSIKGNSPLIEHLVITETAGRRVGFLADQIIGDHKTVIKNLGSFYRKVEGVSGATILGDGTVALILDIPKLIQNMELEEQMVN
ncbi:MAG: chemotaxis protein CheA [Nitrospirae bacterium]|nr:chemotaxis protein CheA [Nitrospirota bacterium]